MMTPEEPQSTSLRISDKKAFVEFLSREFRFQLVNPPFNNPMDRVVDALEMRLGEFISIYEST